MSVAEPSVAARPARPRPGGFRDGWVWLGLVTLARMFLVLQMTLVGFALLPALFGWQGSVVLSGSMQPFIRPGDVVLTATPTQGAPIPEGRIVQFRPASAPTDANPILHRVVAINEDGTYTTAGDANHDHDAPIHRDQIVGEARLLVPFIGLPGYWLRTPNFAALAVWAALNAVAVMALALDRPPRDPNPPPGVARPTGKPSRRVFFALTGAGALAMVVAMARPPVGAAFTARTRMVGNTWTVATLPTLTIGRASGYALLAATNITDTGFLGIGTSITGSIGTSPGASVSGVYSWNVSGSIDRNTASSRNAQTDALALYDAAGARTSVTVGPTLTGTLRPGVYAPASGGLTVSGTLTLDARADRSAIFILKAATLSAANNSVVRLINGASAANVYWRIGGTITLGTGTTNVGNYLARGNVVMGSRSGLIGRLISLTGAITIATATVGVPG